MFMERLSLTKPTLGRAITILAIGLPTLVLILAGLGAMAPVVIEGLPQEPQATLVLLPMVRFVRDVAATLAIGFVLVGGLLCPRPDPRLLRAASIAALSWFISLLAFVVLTISELLAFELRASVQPVVLASFVSQTNLGQLLVVQLISAALLAVLAWAVVNRPTAFIAVGIGLIGTSATALTGHSGLHSGHTSASVSLAIHIAAVALWVGGLVGTLLVARQQPAVIARFSTVALVCAILVAESGLLNASLRLAGPAPLLTTTYGAIVLAKIAAFAWLLRFGWMQRTRVVREVRGGSEVGLRLLARFTVIELAVMGIAFGLAVALSRTEAPSGIPPVSAVMQGSAAALAIGLGALIALPMRRTRVAASVQSLPEVSAIAFLSVLFITTGGTWLPVLLGEALAAIVSALLLVLTGTMLCLAAWSTRGRVAVVIAIAGWAAIVSWSSNEGDPLRWLSMVCGGSVLVAIAVLARRPSSESSGLVEDQEVMSS